MERGRFAHGTSAALLLFVLSFVRAARAQVLVPHSAVDGADVTTGDVRRVGGAWRRVAWDDLETTRLDPGAYELRFRADTGTDGNAISVPVCVGRGVVVVDGRAIVSGSPGPLVVPTGSGAHEVLLRLTVGAYERRIACGEHPRAGTSVRSVEGLGLITFPSGASGVHGRHDESGGGQAAIYVPPQHDLRRPRPLLVGLHPWNGSIWTYAAYATLLREARARDVPLLMPSGLGNSLYTADAEEEVMRAVEAASSVLAVDAQRISLWGASMGGAGATTIAFHRPDRFASVTSFFGDSKYDLASYVRFILPNAAAAHSVNALDIVENARSLPVWLVHGEDDRTSPVLQSAALATAMSEHGFDVRFDRVPGAGHDGALVARFLPGVVASAATARVDGGGARVTYRSVRARDRGAYGIHFERTSPTGDAFVDVERRPDAIHVREAEGVREIVLSPGALGASVADPPRIVFDEPRLDGAKTVTAHWEPGP